MFEGVHRAFSLLMVVTSALLGKDFEAVYTKRRKWPKCIAGKSQKADHNLAHLSIGVSVRIGCLHEPRQPTDV